jgi:hypothetical protein
MIVKVNPDGTITLLVPKVAEIYDEASGNLFIPCLTTVEELARVLELATPVDEADPA